jgi:hypothetical protein
MKTAFLIFSLFLFAWKTLAQAPVKDWDRRYGGNNRDYPWQINKMADGDFLLTGESASSLSGDKTDNPLDNLSPNTWLVKMNRDGTYDWVKTVLCHGTDEYNRCFSNPDGSIIVGSKHYNAIILNACSKNRYVYKITKLAPDLTTEWVKMVHSDSTDTFRDIIPLANGNILVAGYSIGNTAFDKTENSRGYYDLWLVWLDSNGNIIRDKTIGGNALDWVYKGCIHELQDGSLFILAQSESDISGEKSENSRGNRDYWLLKLDAGGNLLWDKTYGGNQIEQSSTIIPTADGNYFLLGVSKSDISGNKTAPNKGNYDYWLIKIDSNGNILWDKTYGGAGNDYGSHMIRIADGNYIISGFSDQGLSGDRSEGSWGSMDYWLVKIDADGNIIWDKTFGSAGYDRAEEIDTIGTDFIIAGRSNGMATGDKSQNTWGDYDYWVLKTKDTPFALEDNILLESSAWKRGIDLRWQITSSPVENTCFYVKRSKDFKNWETMDSVCTAVGSYRERTFFYKFDPQPHNGINYYQVIQVSDAGVKKSNIVSERWQIPNSSPQIYPNPFENELHIEWGGFYPDNAYTFTLFDTKGAPVYESRATAKDGKLTYDLSHLSAGNYNGILRYGGRKWEIRAVKR